MAIRFYRWLVRLHPAAFRERFGAEMLCVYDESSRMERRRLLTDGLVSLARQWAGRSRWWIAGAAFVGAMLQLALAETAWFGAARRLLPDLTPAAPFSQDRSTQEAVLLLGAGIVCAVLLFMTALASLETQRRAKRKGAR